MPMSLPIPGVAFTIGTAVKVRYMKHLSGKFHPFHYAALFIPRFMCAMNVLMGFILVLSPTVLMAETRTYPLKMESLHQIYAAKPLDITTAEFIEIDGDSPPRLTDTNNVRETIVLPPLWNQDDRETRVGWYRFKLDDQPFEGKHAVYLWRFSMNIAVWLNDEFLGDGGRFEKPIARNWNRPFLFLLPSAAWNKKDNYLYVKLAIYSGWGHLPPIIIGPYDELRKDYQRRFTW